MYASNTALSTRCRPYPPIVPWKIGFLTHHRNTSLLVTFCKVEVLQILRKIYAAVAYFKKYSPIDLMWS